ncbi:hypothetical protein LEP1GSC203_0334 [Leptospira terpstrae serovar Hualin str. LT 11-33 = ATCC 700639]|uniref:Uncharacterized protein n=2 Tax=Leptospira TaxID=171 RepID=N1VZ22_9LEPT|nr:hypothetical protein LEP1GSC203_0334 [Leptospira terpstrae serovar Hualin str. LT 11-33 = ATCC 700639]
MLDIDRVVGYSRQSRRLVFTNRNFFQRVLLIFGLSFLLHNSSPTNANHSCESRNCINIQINLLSSVRSSFNGKSVGGDFNGPGYIRFSDNGKLALPIVAKTKKAKTDLRNSKEFCNKLMYELADFVGSSKITGCSAQCRSACGNMWDINSKDGDRCERQCRLCWNVLAYEPNDCKAVNSYPMVLPDKI